MGWTKKQLINEAFNELALQGYVFNVGPEELQGALRRLDSMIATWSGKGISLGYPLPSSPDASDIDADSAVPDTATEAVYMNLAVRLAAGYGKTLAQDTRNTAKQGYDTLLGVATAPTTQQVPNRFAPGAGNKPLRNA